jgi:hypothetical protein
MEASGGYGDLTGCRPQIWKWKGRWCNVIYRYIWLTGTYGQELVTWSNLVAPHPCI